MKKYSIDEYPDIETLPTGMSAFDSMLGGGLPCGKIVEIYGRDGAGKTTLALQIVANNPDKKVVWVDAEAAFNPEYAKGLGVNKDNVSLLRPDYAEEAFEAIEEIVESGEADLIVVDSVPSLQSKGQAEAGLEQQFMGVDARLLSRALRKLLLPLERNGVSLVFLNQLRANINGTQWNPTTRPGGYALKHYSSMQIELKRTVPLKQGENIVGAVIMAKTEKNRIAPPFQKTELSLMYGQGFSAEMDLLDRALEAGVIERKGRTYLFAGEKFASSKKDALKYLEDNADFAAKVENEL